MTTINTIEDLIRVLDENPQWVDALRVRLLTRELIELPETFAKFAEVVNQRLTKLEVDVAGLKVDVAGLRDDVGHLKGWSLESQMHSRIVPLISQALDVRRAEIMRSPVQEMRSELRDTVEDSADSQLISAEQQRRVIVTDFVLKARRRGTSESRLGWRGGVEQDPLRGHFPGVGDRAYPGDHVRGGVGGGGGGLLH